MQGGETFADPHAKAHDGVAIHADQALDRTNADAFSPAGCP
jgi:hypothetical protein